MNFVVDLNLSYDKLVLSAKDFVLLSEILQRSQRVDNHYTESHGTIFVEKPRNKVMVEELMSPIRSFDDLSNIREEERIAREQKEAARELTV